MRSALRCLLLSFLACLGCASTAAATHVNCGDLLTQDTTLDSDLACPGDALRIGADGVTLDLAGHEIRGPGVYSGGVAVDNRRLQPADPRAFNDMRVENGRITDYSTAVRVQDATGGRIADLRLNVNVLFLQGVGGYDLRRNKFLTGSILLNNASSTLVRNNRVDSGRIQVIQGVQNVFDRNTALAMTIAASHSQVTRNLVRSVSGVYGIEVNNSTGNTVAHNVVMGAGVGIGLASQDGAIISGNRVTRSAEDGIRVVFSTDTLLEHNFTARNGDDGIDVDSLPTTLTENIANQNGDLGIEALSGTTDGGGNKARQNGNPAQCTGVGCS